MKIKFTAPIPTAILGFSLVFFIINMWQAYTTPIIDDESYYSFYAENLAWGYYDHPPMVAVLIALGRLFTDGVMGVRLITTLLFSINILLLWQIVNQYKKIETSNFIIIILSFVYIQLYGFVTTADVPFIFFSLLFFRQYQRYLRRSSLFNGLTWGTIMALLMYSKYLGVLLVVFTLLAHIKLLQRGSFWAAGIFGILLFAPHLHWQWLQGFPSLYYHLFYRAEPSFRLDFLLNSLLNVPVVILPVGWLGVWYLIKDKTGDLFIRVLKFNVVGTVLFFAFFSTTNIVQPQWLTTFTLAVMIYTLLHFGEKGHFHKYAKRLSLLAVFVSIIVRLVLASIDLVSKKFFLNIRDMDWTHKIAEKLDGSPALFINGFQQASLYHFYTQKPVFCFNSVVYRQTQFDIWDFETAFYGKTVYLVRTDSFFGAEPMDIDPYNTYYICPIEDYKPFQKMKIETKSLVVDGNTITAEIALFNPYPFDFTRNEKLRVCFHLMLKDKAGRIQLGIPLAQQLDFIAAGATNIYDIEYTLKEGLDMKSYKSVGVSLYSPLLGGGFNGDFVDIRSGSE